MQKCSRREAILILLSGVGCLGGCQTPSGYRPTLPESCVWLKFPYTWMCIDPREGGDVPPSKESTEQGSSLPGTSELSSVWTTPPSWWEFKRNRDSLATCL